MKKREIETETLKKLMKHLSKCNALLEVQLKEKIKEKIHKSTVDYQEWKALGMEFEWHEKIKHYERLLDDIEEEKQFYIEAVQLMKNAGLEPEDWVF